MSPTLLFTLSLAVTLAAGIGVGLMRQFALRRAILDIPNERSSHITPTPRGGGLPVVLVILAALLFTRGWFPGEDQLGLVMLSGGALIALVGWLDDCYHLSAALRFSCQLLVSLLAVALLSPADAGWLEKAFPVLIVTWSINFYNFRDGLWLRFFRGFGRLGATDPSSIRQYFSDQM